MRSPRCSVVVPVFNGLEFLEPMLASLRDCTPDGLYELILSDDGSDATTQSFLESQSNWSTVIFAKENCGFAAACSAGAKAARGEFLVFLNTDLELRPGWLEKLLACAEEDDKIGAVGCKLLYPDGTIQHGGVFLREDRLDRIPLIASHDHVGKRSNDPDANRRADLLAVTAAAFLVRKSAFEEVGGFDESYFNGYEDVDLCLELGKAGWRIVYEPACELIHFESKSGANRFASVKENQRRFLEKWNGRVRPEVLVTEHYEVGPHPDWRPLKAFVAVEKKETPRARIVVLPNSHVGSLALTLESAFASRVGLYDRVVVVIEEGDQEAAAYLKFCEGLDDAFSWQSASSSEALHDALEGGSEDFVAFVSAGTILTQGWLARLILFAGEPGVGAVGPLLSSGSGPQNGMALLQGGGTFHPNEISQGFAGAFRGQGVAVDKLENSCFLLRSDLAVRAVSQGANTLAEVQAWLGRQGLPLIAAKDVFVHVDNREGALARAA